ncbi:MAG: hypothetical protein GXO43_02240 [Crenarchaeota archaeon]|nr:hypothetical protein [Thermoproteota archaeon]
MHKRKRPPAKVRGIFKRLKAGITTWDDLSEDEIKELKKWYPFLFK